MYTDTYWLKKYIRFRLKEVGAVESGAQTKKFIERVINMNKYIDISRTLSYINEYVNRYTLLQGQVADFTALPEAYAVAKKAEEINFEAPPSDQKVGDGTSDKKPQSSTLDSTGTTQIY